MPTIEGGTIRVIRTPTYFVESSPSLLRNINISRSLYGSLQPGGPDLHSRNCLIVEEESQGTENNTLYRYIIRVTQLTVTVTYLAYCSPLSDKSESPPILRHEIIIIYLLIQCKVIVCRVVLYI